MSATRLLALTSWQRRLLPGPPRLPAYRRRALLTTFPEMGAHVLTGAHAHVAARTVFVRSAHFRAGRWPP